MGMNKGKLKREKKELEKLFTQGRYGDFLLGVEKDGAGDLFPHETEKAWRELAQTAVATQGGMTLYFNQRRRLNAVPDLPDLRFLDLVERFLRGEDPVAEVSSLSKLSPAACTMAQQLTQWDTATDILGVMETLFEQFITAPALVTRTKMETAVRFFAGLYPWALEFLPDALETLDIMSQGKLDSGEGSVDFEALAEMEQAAQDAALVVPESILHIFLAPLLWRLGSVYEHFCAVDESCSLELAGITPYLSSLLVGSRWDEVDNFLNHGDLTQRYEQDPRYVRKKIDTTAFPDKVRLLMTLENTLSQLRKQSNATDSQEPDLEQYIRADYLFLYLDVLAHLGRDRSHLSLLDQGELVQVMGGYLDRAFVIFVSAPRECDEFLQGIAQAGLLNTKLALTSLLLARTTGNRILREAAERALTLLPPAVKEDIHWLFKYFGFLSYPSLSAFSPIIRQIRNQEPLLELFADLVAIQVTSALVSNQMVNFSRLAHFQNQKKQDGRDMKQDMTEFRDELSDYFDIGAFGHLFMLAESYPEGYITESGYRKVIAAQYARSGIVEIIRRMKLLPPPPPGMTVMDTQRSALFGMELRVCLELLKQHFDDLRQVPLDSFATLIEILERSGRRTVETSFLAGLSTILQKRSAAGEEGVIPLLTRIQLLIRV